MTLAQLEKALGSNGDTELAFIIGVHRNTVRNWRIAGGIRWLTQLELAYRFKHVGLRPSRRDCPEDDK